MVFAAKMAHVCVCLHKRLGDAARAVGRVRWGGCGAEGAAWGMGGVDTAATGACVRCEGCGAHLGIRLLHVIQQFHYGYGTFRVAHLGLRLSAIGGVRLGLNPRKLGRNGV